MDEGFSRQTRRFGAGERFAYFKLPSGAPAEARRTGTNASAPKITASLPLRVCIRSGRVICVWRLLPIVTLDDAADPAVFAASFGVVRTMANDSLDLLSIQVNPLEEIIASLTPGTVFCNF